ncbi:DUF2314 domain-containing protein [Flavobacterium sp. FlaQc-57]|uniref:DUF2314 domain-containing protein n=1 Tax=Flavobacterium sp. FlaQc-57 TaxID=3374186 RepID=UPI0037575ECE
MADKRNYFSKEDNLKMTEAYEQAQSTFKYFWREVSWDYRRIVPALDLSCVKVAFSESFEDSDETVVEHMWITDVEFDGDVIKGILINTPNDLKNISNGDIVKIELNQVSDWLFSIAGETYGGFTIHAMKTEMNDEEKAEYYDAWGLDFDDCSTIKIAHKQGEKPENIIEHPMSINMKESLIDFLTQNPNELLSDQAGYNFLHRETIAGNLTLVKVLLNLGIDKNIRTKHGKTALDFAKQLNWEHIIPVLES